MNPDSPESTDSTDSTDNTDNTDNIFDRIDLEEAAGGMRWEPHDDAEDVDFMNL